MEGVQGFRLIGSHESLNSERSNFLGGCALEIINLHGLRVAKAGVLEFVGDDGIWRALSQRYHGIGQSRLKDCVDCQPASPQKV
jgi:hypothetical protein